MFNLEGKNAYVTGAAGGIGQAVAARFCLAGAKVIITDVTDASRVADDPGADDRLRRAGSVLGN